MDNQLATQNAGVPAVAGPVGGPEILSDDLVLEKLLLQQGLSDLVAEKKAQAGDFVKSVSTEKYGDDEVPVSFVPLTFKNKWIIKEEVAGKFEFRRMEDRNASNSDRDWDYKENGTNWKRVKVTQVYALLLKDIEKQEEVRKQIENGEMPDLNSTLLPVVISFQSTGFKAGQGVVTHFAKAAQMTAEFGTLIHPHGYSMDVGCTFEENAKGKFYVPNVKTGPKLTDTQFSAAQKWVEILNHRPDIKVDNSDEEAVATPQGEPQY